MYSSLCGYDLQRTLKVRSDNDLDKMMNTEAFKKMRRKMIAGKRPVECRDCWIREDSGIKSDRQTMIEQDLKVKKEEVLYDSVNDNYQTELFLTLKLSIWSLGIIISATTNVDFVTLIVAVVG